MAIQKSALAINGTNHYAVAPYQTIQQGDVRPEDVVIGLTAECHGWCAAPAAPLENWHWWCTAPAAPSERAVEAAEGAAPVEAPAEATPTKEAATVGSTEEAALGAAAVQAPMAEAPETPVAANT